jgi:hypothetical protein
MLMLVEASPTSVAMQATITVEAMELAEAVEQELFLVPVVVAPGVEAAEPIPI